MIYTIGHGNRAIEDFIALLKEAGIECLVDGLASLQEMIGGN